MLLREPRACGLGCVPDPLAPTSSPAPSSQPQGAPGAPDRSKARMPSAPDTRPGLTLGPGPLCPVSVVQPVGLRDCTSRHVRIVLRVFSLLPDSAHILWLSPPCLHLSPWRTVFSACLALADWSCTHMSPTRSVGPRCQSDRPLLRRCLPCPLRIGVASRSPEMSLAWTLAPPTPSSLPCQPQR